MADRGRDLKFDILTDTSKFDTGEPVRELNQLARASDSAATDTESLADELKRLALQGKDAQKQLDALNRETAQNKFDEMGTDAKAAGKKAEDAFDSLAKNAKADLKTVERSSHDSMKTVGHHTEEFRDEAKQNWSEVASSFTGDMTSAIDLVQGTLGGLASSIPGVGAAIAGVAALGVGVIGAIFQNAQTSAEEAKQAAQDYFQVFEEGQGRITKAAVLANANKLLGDPDKLKELTKQADAAGIAVVDYALALSGSIPDQKAVNEQLDRQAQKLKNTVAPNIDAKNALADQSRALQTARDRLGETTKAIDTGRTSWKLLQEATKKAAVMDVEVDAPSAGELQGVKSNMAAQFKTPIQAPIAVHAPVSEAATARAQMMQYFTRNPLQIPAVVNPRDPHGKPIRDIK